MDANYIIESAQLTDLDAVCAIEEPCFGADSFSRRQLAYLISRANGAFFVVRCEGRVVAYVSLVKRRGTSNVRIYSVAAHPDFQGRHLGQALLDRSRQYAVECGAKRLSLEVNSSNATALNLYIKNGFRHTATLPSYYHDGSDALRMVCDVY